MPVGHCLRPGAGHGIITAFDFNREFDYIHDQMAANRNYFATGFVWAGRSGWSNTTNAPPTETPTETPEEREAREAEWRALVETRDRRREEARGAAERAEELLKARLGRHRYKLFQVTRALTRKSLLWPGIMYVIRRDAKVQVIDRGHVKTELCVISGHGEPEADRIMSILDLLETDEAKLWEMANVFPHA